tara:strand:+ start:119745 stop:120257 length:513 start_codon:yes stop_codon:yes gene_type:complete
MRFEYPNAQIEEQPVRIEYTDEDSKARKYTPDFLVTRPGQQALLVEVKPSNRVADILKSKIQAASDFASQKGWKFEIWTEKEIRGPRLENAHFLQMFRNADTDAETKQFVIETLSSLQPVKLQSLLETLWPYKEDRALGLPVVWNLVANKEITFDLNTKICPQTMLRLAR